jgi:hypothetical protein
VVVPVGVGVEVDHGGTFGLVRHLLGTGPGATGLLVVNGGHPKYFFLSGRDEVSAGAVPLRSGTFYEKMMTRQPVVE